MSLTAVSPDRDGDAALLEAVALACPPGAPRLAVAVSGGGDSLALLHLLNRVATPTGVMLHAVTLDHRLRPGSTREAAYVGEVCAGLGVPHAVLSWDRGPAGGNLMAEARAARRSLIGDWARGQGIDTVALGHTADDQAEGFLMALSREAGLDGLCGMQPLQRQDGLTWLRPLLAQTRADLRAYLTRHGVRWIDDPTNEDPRFLRTRARAALAALAGIGVTAPGIARSVAMLSLARGALEADLAAFVREHVKDEAGALTVDRGAFAALHGEMQRRLLAAAVRWIGGAAHPPRRSGLMQALLAITGAQGATTGGVRFRVGPRWVRIVREPRAAGRPVPVGQVWDGRWTVTGPPGPEVRALGAAGLAQVPRWRHCGVARDALVVSPGVWSGGQLLAAPIAGFGTGYSARIVRSFVASVMPH